MKKALGLIELLVASALVLVVIMAVFALDTSSRKYYKSSEYTALVAAELSFAAEHMHKRIMKVAGKAGNEEAPYNIVEIDPTHDFIEFYVDLNSTPSELEDDTLMRYADDRSRNAIYFCDDWTGTECLGNVEYLAQGHVLKAEFEPFLNDEDEELVCGLDLKINGRYDASKAAVVHKNPEYDLDTSFFLGEYSLS